VFHFSPKAGCTTFFWLGAVSERSGHFFNSVVAVPRSAVPFTLKQQNLVYRPCSTVNVAINCRSAHIFHRCSSCNIFCSNTCMFSNVSFMWTARASVIEGNLFPPWRNTALILTLDESMKGLHCPEVCSSWILPLILDFYCSTIDHHPVSNTLLCLTASAYKMILLHFCKEDSTA